jgi:circadian clock protein KaiB
VNQGSYQLRLYIAGATPAAKSAIERIERICEVDLGGRYRLEIVDVLEDPDRAEADRVMATPTLIKELPPPLRRVIGDLSDRQNVLLGLDLRAPETPNEEGHA